MEIYLKEADVPLVGCFANDTENRFTAGIDNNSEEIKKVTTVTLPLCSCLFFVLFLLVFFGGGVFAGGEGARH